MEGPQDVLGAPASPAHGFQVDLDGHVAPDGGDELAGAGLVGVGAQALPDPARHLVGVRQHLLEGAVLRDELLGGLLADARHSRDVVRGVALQAEVVRDLVRGDPVALLDGGRVVDGDVGDALARRDDAHVVVDQLERVTVAGHEQHAHAARLRAFRQRAEDVVALPALGLDDRHVQRAQHVLRHRELHPKLVGHGGALHLVPLEDLRSERGLPPVERHDDRVRTELARPSWRASR